MKNAILFIDIEKTKRQIRFSFKSVMAFCREFGISYSTLSSILVGQYCPKYAAYAPESPYQKLLHRLKELNVLVEIDQ